MAGQGGRLMPVDHYLKIHCGPKLLGGLLRVSDFYFDEVERPRKYGRFSQVLADEWGAERRALLSAMEAVAPTAKVDKELQELYKKSFEKEWYVK